MTLRQNLGAASDSESELKKAISGQVRFSGHERRSSGKDKRPGGHLLEKRNAQTIVRKEKKSYKKEFLVGTFHKVVTIANGINVLVLSYDMTASRIVLIEITPRTISASLTRSVT